MSNSNSFQILLEAEQQASALVNEARQCKWPQQHSGDNILIYRNCSLLITVDRAQRLKDARREALEEIEELKRKKSEELVENEKKVREGEIVRISTY